VFGAIQYMFLTKIKLEMGHIPCIRYFFPRQLLKPICSPPQHLHVFGMGRTNSRRTCHPSFSHYWPFSKLCLLLRTISGIGSRYTFWPLSVWQLSCVFELFLLTRAGGQGGWSCFDDFGLSHIVLDAGMVHQFQRVSWRMRRILGRMETRLLLIEGYTCKPIALLLALLSIGLWRCPTACVAPLV